MLGLLVLWRSILSSWLSAHPGQSLQSTCIDNTNEVSHYHDNQSSCQRPSWLKAPSISSAMSANTVSLSDTVGDAAPNRQCIPPPKANTLYCCTRQCCRTAALVQPVDLGGSMSALQQISPMSWQQPKSRRKGRGQAFGDRQIIMISSLLDIPVLSSRYWSRRSAGSAHANVDISFIRYSIWLTVRVTVNMSSTIHSIPSYHTRTLAICVMFFRVEQ